MKQKKNLFCKALLILSFAGIAVMVCSCSASATSAAINGKATVEIKQTSSITQNQKYTFKLPPLGSDKIYAERITCADDAEAFEYEIRALTGYDYPYAALQINLVPSYKTKEGKEVAAHIDVRVTEYRIDLDEALEWNKEKNRYEYGYEAPNTWFYTLDASNGFTEENYRIPNNPDGKLSVEFNSSAKFGVTGDEEYSDLISYTYPLLNLDVVCPIKL